MKRIVIILAMVVLLLLGAGFFPFREKDQTAAVIFANPFVSQGPVLLLYSHMKINLESPEELPIHFHRLEPGTFDPEKPAEQVAVLMYHHILPREENIHPNNPAIINLEDFQRQMAYLEEQGFTTLTLMEFELFLKGELQVPANSVLITFDDGYQSECVHAGPVLAEHGFTAASFLITSYVPEKTQEYRDDRLSYKSMEEVLSSLEVFEYGSHSHNLHHLEGNQGLMVTKSREDVQEDLFQSRQIIDSPYFAYPYGHYNDVSFEVLSQLDFRLAFTTKEGYARPGDDLYQVKRFAVTPFVPFQRFVDTVEGRR